MARHRIAVICALVAPLALVSPVLATNSAADPASAVGKAGQVVLDAVAGRTYLQAFVKSHSPVNPFGIDLAAVAHSAGVASPTGDLGGTAAEGQLSILPQYNTPATRFGNSRVTPAIIPFAFMHAGACEGGYATGFPTANRIVSVDMQGRACSASAIDAALVDQYVAALAAAKADTTQVAAAVAKQDTPSPATSGSDPVAGLTGGITPAVKDSDIDKVGQVILAAVDGRTVEAAISDGNDRDNPFGLDAEPLLLAAGVYFLHNDADGAPLEASEFSIYADFSTPGGKFKPSAETPAFLPFAFNRGGTCQGGYVSGFPVADAIYTVDMAGRVCNARTIDDLVGVRYHAISAETATPDAAPAQDAGAASSTDAVADNSGPAPASAGDNEIFDGTAASDHDLEMIVFGAYTGAYNQALKHNNAFESDELSFADLRNAIRNALEKEGYGAANVLAAPVASAAEAKACATDGHIDLRIAFNNDGVGIVLAAVSDTRLSAYEYDPTNGAGLVITHADACLVAVDPAGKGAKTNRPKAQPQ